MISPTRKQYFDNIDIFRGFAAISVVVYHVIEHYEWESFPTSGPLTWFRIGWMGVDLFFVISGFVIALSAFSMIEKTSTTKFRLPFLKKRVARIVPLHYLTMLIFLVFISPEMINQNIFKDLIAHLLFLHNLFINYHGAINGSNWTLGTEMQFYVLMIIIGPWLLSARWWKSYLLLVVISWTWRSGVTLFTQSSPTLGVFPIFCAATQLPGMLDEFAAGILLAIFIRSAPGKELLSKFSYKHIALHLATVSLLTLSLIVFWKYASFWNHPLMVIFFRTLLAASFALALLSACALRINPSLKRILSPIYYLGTISYGIYLWHLPILLSVKHVPGITPQTALFTVIILTIIFSSISWHFFEKQFLKKPRL